MAGRQYDARVEWVSLHHEYLVIVTLKQRVSANIQGFQLVKNSRLTLFLLREPCNKNVRFNHSQTKHAAAVQMLHSTLSAGSLTPL